MGTTSYTPLLELRVIWQKIEGYGHLCTVIKKDGAVVISLHRTMQAI